MYLIGDIGNSEIKVCLVNSKNTIIKKINFSSNTITFKTIKKNFKKLNIDFNNIEKILFCSVVPKSLNLIKKYLKTKTKIRCFEVKELALSSLLKIKI